jgi:hypothetical protein
MSIGGKTMRIRYLVTVLALAALAGCGAETMSAAATAGGIKRQELQQGQKTLEQSKAKIDQAMQLQQQRADQSAERN